MGRRIDQLEDDPKGKSFNEDLTARPSEVGDSGVYEDPGDMAARPFDYGEMNEEDAKTSGYTDEKGHAISKPKKTSEKH